MLEIMHNSIPSLVGKSMKISPRPGTIPLGGIRFHTKLIRIGFVLVVLASAVDASQGQPGSIDKLLPIELPGLLVVGENHTSVAQRLYVRDNLASLREHGYLNLFLEVFPSDLRTDERMRAKLIRSGHSDSGADAFMAIITEARRLGMGVVGIDKDIPWPWAGEPPSRAEFYRFYVVERNRAIIANLRRAGGKGVLLIGRNHLGLRGDPRQADLVRELGRDGDFDFKTSLEAAGIRSMIISLCGGGETAGEPHVFDVIMRQRGKAGVFSMAAAGQLAGDFIVKLPN